MITWIKQLFHLHEYEIIQQGIIYNKYNNHIGNWYDNRCKHCGKIKHLKF